MRHHDNDNNKFKYKTTAIVEAVRANRDKHEAEFNASMTEYRKQMITELERKLAKAKDGEDTAHTINLIRPVNYLKEYDRALKMFGMTTDEIVELDSRTFEQLIMDEWDWSDGFKATVHNYSMSR